MIWVMVLPSGKNRVWEHETMRLAHRDSLKYTAAGHEQLERMSFAVCAQRFSRFISANWVNDHERHLKTVQHQGSSQVLYSNWTAKLQRGPIISACREAEVM